MSKTKMYDFLKNILYERHVSSMQIRLRDWQILRLKRVAFFIFL